MEEVDVRDRSLLSFGFHRSFPRDGSTSSGNSRECSAALDRRKQIPSLPYRHQGPLQIVAFGSSDAVDSTLQRSSAGNGDNSEQPPQMSLSPHRSSADYVNSSADIHHCFSADCAADSTPHRSSADNSKQQVGLVTLRSSADNSKQQVTLWSSYGNSRKPSADIHDGSSADYAVDCSNPHISSADNSERQISLSPHRSSAHNGGSSKQAWQHIRIFTTDVLLPPHSCICNSVGKLIEVDARGYQFSVQDLDEIRENHYPQLLVEWVDKETLCFQIPSSSSTDIASKFEVQISAYLKRFNKTSEIDTRPSSSLFKATTPQSSGRRICPDLTIFDLSGYEQKLDAAMAQRHTVPDDVRVYATLEVQSLSQSEDEIRNACKKEARLIDCISIAILVKTGEVEIYNSTQRLYASFNPRYIDVGSHCSQLNGLRLYLDPLRHAKGWRYPPHPSSYCHEDNYGGTLPVLLAAIQVADFIRAENIVNYMESLKEDERPLLEAVKQASLPDAHAFVEFLLKNGACPSQDMQSISAILIATAAKNQVMINLLSQHGALAPDIGPDTLVAAVRKGDIEFVTSLIRAGSEPNQPSSSGRLALVEAIPSMVIVEAIVNTAGHVEFGKKDLFGISAIAAAKRLPTKEILHFLESRGGLKSFLRLMKDVVFKRGGRRQQ